MLPCFVTKEMDHEACDRNGHPRTFAEVVIWEQGQLRRAGRVDMRRTALEGFRKTLQASDDVVVEATGNTMALVRVLSPFVARVIIANPLQVRAIAHAHVKTDKIDAGVLAASMPQASCPRSGRRRPRPSACGGSWRVATRSCVIARASRTRFIRSCMRILCRVARMPIFSAVSVEPG